MADLSSNISAPGFHNTLKPSRKPGRKRWNNVIKILQNLRQNWKNKKRKKQRRLKKRRRPKRRRTMKS